MKLGIIIICYNIENSIDILQSSKYLNKVHNLKICFVNNCSNDNTYELLKDLKELSENISIVNIKKFKNENSAVKAGARFMTNQYNLKHLGYVNLSIESEPSNLSFKLKEIYDNHEGIIEHIQKITRNKPNKLTMFQSLFAISEYLCNENKYIYCNEF